MSKQHEVCFFLEEFYKESAFEGYSIDTGVVLAAYVKVNVIYSFCA